jgi:hypothetical protein
MFTTGTAPAVTATTSATVQPSEKVKFLLVSTHLQQFTGYAKVGHGILTELSAQPWLQLTHYGFQRMTEVPAGFRPYPAGVEVIDAVSLEKPVQQGFGYTALPDVIRRKRPHVVMIYNDLSVVGKFMEEIRKSGIPRTFKIWVYCDQVYTMQPQVCLDLLNRDADRIFTFTNSWKQCLKDQGITRPIDTLLHGFHSNMFFPVPKELARRQLQLPNDIFVFMCMNRNQPRKRYDLLVMAFVELLVKYPTKPVYLLAVCAHRTDRLERAASAIRDGQTVSAAFRSEDLATPVAMLRRAVENATSGRSRMAVMRSDDSSDDGLNATRLVRARVERSSVQVTRANELLGCT